ncbi:MAG: rRNA maturation RNase YbeY [Spirochaetales bacterium]|nr:rRNA maturation RNase YbeY [Spirochaetales bacterium]
MNEIEPYQEFEYQNSIDISYKNTHPPEWIKNIEAFSQLLLKKLDIKNREISLLFCDDIFIRELNKKYRGKDSPTDVLAFPQENDTSEVFAGDMKSGKICAGDVVISIPTLIRNADEYHIPREEELSRLIIHGVLHLMGMDHMEEGSDMLVLQEKLLKDIKGGYG